MSSWRISLPAAKLSALREDPAFAELLVLARIANALRFASSAGVSDPDGQLADQRRRSSFMLISATLSEALHTLQRMGRHFRSFPAYGGQISPLLSDKHVGGLRRDVLVWLRDKAVFHFDDDVSPIGLVDLEGDWTFAEGVGSDLLSVSYPLADFVLVRALLKQQDTEASLKQAYAEILAATLDLASQMLNALDTLIGQVLASYGLQWEERSA